MGNKSWNRFESMRRILEILAIGGALIAAAILFAAVRNGSFSTALDLIPPPGSADALLATMPAGVEYDTVTVQAISSDNPGVVMPVAAVDACLYLLGAMILWLLSKVFREAEHGRAFAAANVRRMRAVAWLAVVLALVAFYAKPFVMAWASSQVGEGSWSVSANFAPFFVAVTAFALAAIWQRGAELEDLEEHTV